MAKHELEFPPTFRPGERLLRKDLLQILQNELQIETGILLPQNVIVSFFHVLRETIAYVCEREGKVVIDEIGRFYTQKRLNSGTKLIKFKFSRELARRVKANLNPVVRTVKD